MTKRIVVVEPAVTNGSVSEEAEVVKLLAATRGAPTNIRPAGAHRDKRRKTRAEQLRQELEDE
jgi:hypothetical protein